jgi:small subunit ribosomal protein S4e
MGSRIEKHLSRLAMPKTWKIKRKGIKWVTRPNSGAHSFKLGLSINLLLRDILSYARTAREVKNILYNQEILVDGVKVKDHRFIVGLMDIVSIPKTKENFRILLNKKGYITAVPVKPEEAKIKPCKIIGKTAVKKAKLQVNLFDGKNILADKQEASVGDTAFIEIPSKKIKQIVRLEKGAYVFMSGGKHIGSSGVIESIDKSKIIYKKDKSRFETLKKYAFVIGKDKPLITLPEK